MIAEMSVYENLAEFMASMDPAKVLAFHAPASMQQRVDALLEKKQEQGLTEKEAEELEHYFIVEHIVRLAKTRARLHLSRAEV